MSSSPLSFSMFFCFLFCVNSDGLLSAVQAWRIWRTLPDSVRISWREPRNVTACTGIWPMHWHLFGYLTICPPAHPSNLFLNVTLCLFLCFFFFFFPPSILSRSDRRASLMMWRRICKGWFHSWENMKLCSTNWLPQSNRYRNGV